MIHRTRGQDRHTQVLWVSRGKGFILCALSRHHSIHYHLLVPVRPHAAAAHRRAANARSGCASITRRTLGSERSQHHLQGSCKRLEQSRRPEQRQLAATPPSHLELLGHEPPLGVVALGVAAVLAPAPWPWTPHHCMLQDLKLCLRPATPLALGQGHHLSSLRWAPCSAWPSLGNCGAQKPLAWRCTIASCMAAMPQDKALASPACGCSSCRPGRAGWGASNPAAQRSAAQHVAGRSGTGRLAAAGSRRHLKAAC